MSDGYHIEDEVQVRSYDAHLMRRLLRYVRPYRGWMIVATLLLVVVAFLGNLIPVLVMWSVDHYINNPERIAASAEGGLTPAELAKLVESDIGGLFFMTLLFAGIIFSEAIIRYVQIIIVSIVGQRTMLEMRMGLFDHLQRMSLAFLDRNPVGRRGLPGLAGRSDQPARSGVPGDLLDDRSGRSLVGDRRAGLGSPRRSRSQAPPRRRGDG